LESIQHIKISISNKDNIVSINILDDALTVCKFLIEGLMTANILAQSKIKTMSYEYTEETSKKVQLILFVNENSIDFKGEIAKHMKKLFANPLGEFFMADFCD
jgi:hypothetical protein